jgi:hypothetical protein
VGALWAKAEEEARMQTQSLNPNEGMIYVAYYFQILIPAQRDEAITSSPIFENNSSLGVSAMLTWWRQKSGTTGLASKAERKWICFVCFCTGF